MADWTGNRGRRRSRCDPFPLQYLANGIEEADDASMSAEIVASEMHARFAGTCICCDYSSRLASSAKTSLHIVIGIADHPRCRQVNPAQARRAEQHARRWFPAIAARLDFVWTVKRCINLGSGSRQPEPVDSARVHLLQAGLRHQPLRDAALVGNDDDGKSRRGS